MTVEDHADTTVPGTATVPQAVLEGAEPHATFLVATIDEGGEGRVRQLLPKLPGFVRAVRSRVPGSHLSCVAGIGSRAWDRLFTAPPPAQLHPFREIAAEGRRAVSTPADLLFHIRATSSDLCFELAGEIVTSLTGAVTFRDEVIGFKYFGEQNLLGFVDGTENPTGRAASDAVLVGSEDPNYAGGAYVVVQKYLHDLPGWNALTVEEQQRIIGRTRSSNRELDSEFLAPDSHVALNKVVGPDGAEQQILRFNMPFGSAARGEYGTYFIGYARTPTVIEQMLHNMFLGTASASHDRILDFSQAVTGALFFTPSMTFLDNPLVFGDSRQADAQPSTASMTDGSLQIGGDLESLRSA